ncbi:glycerate kinase [Rostrohypoxylon terebratum]|nr:glycerate kinase [Rostrohypoxylon terebratum]
MSKLRFLAVCSSFGGGGLGSETVAKYMEKGIRSTFPEESAVVRKIPLYDDGSFYGGEFYDGYFLRLFLELHHCDMISIVVNSPFCNWVNSWFWVTYDGKTAIIDPKAIYEPNKTPNYFPDPAATVSYGVGELIKAALELDCTKIIVVCEDSEVFDGGAGMLCELGAKLLDVNGEELVEMSGPDLACLDMIDMKSEVRIEVVSPFMDVLCGTFGVALSDGPQSKASIEQIENLSLGLETFGEVAGNLLGEDIRLKPGSGVSGGLGTGLMLLEAQFRKAGEAATEYLSLDTLFNEPWDLILIATQRLSCETPRAKKIMEFAQLAKQHGVDVLAVAGVIGDDIPSDYYDKGITSYLEIPEQYIDMEFTVAEHIQREIERYMRILRIGMSLNKG